jgi:uncharacterized protein YdiU (UPF0061 family)
MPDFGLKLENHYTRLPDEFYTLMPAEKVGVQPRLLHANASAAALIGMYPAAFSDPSFTRVFSGHAPLEGFSPLAMVYSGHQFGVWAGQLGDGRALLIGQTRAPDGALWDIQLKGAGETPYSRRADGRAVMRSSIREYLCSEAMAALGIPTTRALALVATNEQVYREVPEPGAVLTRLAPSHIRFGHFEHFFHTNRPEHVRLLADHVIEEYFPGMVGDHARWFGEVVKRTADLMAGWQSVGFAHGVMNTDNMSILGITLDYGPFGFMEAYEPGFICNHTDSQGRYAFDMQPSIAHWNLRALAFALSSLIPKEALIGALDTYEGLYRRRYRVLMRAKLGLVQDLPGDDMLIGNLLTLMVKTRADDSNPDAQSWLSRYRARTESEDLSGLDRVNPKYVLRNWVAETAIRAVEDRGDIATLDRTFRLVQAPFETHDGDEAFAAPPPPELCDLEVSCSS